MREVVQELSVEAKKIREALGQEKIIWALVVDDNLIDRMLRKRNLESIGCTVEFAESGENALELVRKKLESGEVYRFVCCDYHMGNGKTGAQVVCDLKQFKEYEATIIWCVTTQVEQMQREISEGLDANGNSDLFDTLRFTSKDPYVEGRKFSAPVTAGEKAAADPLTETLLQGSHDSTRRHSAPPRVGSLVERCLPNCSIQ